MAYANIEPFGEFRQELRHGQVMAMTANLNRDTKSKTEPFTAMEFMNFIIKEPERELTQEEIQEKIDKEIFGL